MHSAFGGQKSSQNTASLNPFRGRGRGRGQGRGSSQQSATPTVPDTNAFNQSSRGTVNTGFRGSRGRGAARSRGTLSKTFNNAKSSPFGNTAAVPKSNLPVLPIDPPPDQIRAYSHEELESRRTKLNEQYETYRQNAIKNGLMSGDEQSSLDDAIKTVGTCTQMCDEKERVSRIYESQTDAAERLPAPNSGKAVPIEGRMVKKFRRSAAGVDKQIPEELRTPPTLRKTLDYLFDEIIGKNRLGKHHKFVWDRTRAIRNDFSIQSLTKPEFVRDEVDCYERIVRFHILSAHQLSDPANLAEDEHFEHQQELEQLQKTFQSLLDRYDAFRSQMDFPNEAEFRAYYILYSPILLSFDTEVQIQGWPRRILNDGRVRTALTLYAAMGNTFRSVGSRNLEPIPVAIAQANVGRFWTILESRRVGYLMACVAEMSFQNVRFTAMNVLWRTAKLAPPQAQTNMKSWTRSALMSYLRFDYDEDLDTFCEKVGVGFKMGQEEEYLDFGWSDAKSLINPFSKPEQIFSHQIVEDKRSKRTLVAVMNGMSIAKAQHAGLVEQSADTPVARSSDQSSMFVGDDEDDDEDENDEEVELPKPSLDPMAAAFTPSSLGLQTTATPGWQSKFGQERTPDTASPSDPPKGLFGASLTTPAAPSPAKSTFGFGIGFGSPSAAPASSTSKSQDVVHDSGNMSSKPATPIVPGFGSLGQMTASPFGKATSDQPQQGQSQVSEVQTSAVAQPVTTTTSTVTSETPKPFFTFSTTPTGSVQASDLSTPDRQPASDPQAAKPILFNFSQSTANPTAPISVPAPSTIPSLPTFTHPKSTTPKQVPTFNFAETVAQPSKESKAPLFNFTSSSADKLGATSNASEAAQLPTSQAKRPSLGEIRFPSVLQPDDRSASPGSISDLADDRSVSPGSVSDPKLALPTFKTNSTLKSTESQPIPLPAFNPEEVLTQLCRLGLVQEQGIIDMFVSYKISSLVKDTFNKYQKQKFDAKIAKIRNQVIKRKFFQKWHRLVTEKRLARKAISRRARMVANARAASKRRAMQEHDLTEILAAQEERKRVQMEIQQRQQEIDHMKAAERARRAQVEAARLAERSVSAGAKRKITDAVKSSNNIQDISMSPIHKRSRTLGGHVDTSFLRSSVLDQSRRSLNGSDSLRRSVSQRSLNQSFRESTKVDRTTTDYFELMARGIDPTLGAQSDKSKPRSEDQAIRPQPRVSKSTSPPEIASTAPIQAEPVRPSKVVYDPAKDPFLQKLKSAEAALSADKDWFKGQTAQLERQVQQEEEFRRSQDSLVSASSPQSSGFARSFSGRDYVPPPLKPGQTLSRTEMRIRETGARGFATKPFGGTPVASPSSSYSVPMSKRSASQLQTAYLRDAAQAASSVEHATQAQPVEISTNSKRTFQAYANGHTDEEEVPPVYMQQASKKQRNGIVPQAQSRNTKLALMQNLQADEYDEDDAEEYDDGSIDNYDDEELVNGQHYVDEEDEEDEQEDGDDELYDSQEGEEDIEDFDHYDTRAEMYGEEEAVDENGDYLVPVSRSSRAVSAATPDTGFGSTADAAIELSD